MSRGSTPERLDEARQAATRARLIGQGATPVTADAWIAAWAEQAGRDTFERGAAYWDAAWRRMSEGRTKRIRPE